MKKKIVIKLGGSSLHNPATLQELVGLVRGYQEQNFDVVLVHGGGPAINQELTKRGITWQFINGQRQTTFEMMVVIEEVLAGKINSMLVNTLFAVGINAYGLSGATEKTLFCTQASTDLMLVGKIENVGTEALTEALKKGLVPVVAPIGIGSEGEKYNINADWAAAKIAMTLKAHTLIFLTDQNGILDQDSQLVPHVTPTLINKMIDQGVISGGMYTKVMTMMAALNSGIREVRVLNAAVASELFTDHSKGTVLAKTKPKVKEVKKWIHQMI